MFVGPRGSVEDRSPFGQAATVLVGLLAGALIVWAPRAMASDVFTLDSQPDTGAHVIEDSAGTAYVGWVRQAGGTALDPPMFCKIPAGGTCINPISLSIPGASSSSDDVSGVFPVFGGGSLVYVVGPRYVQGDVMVWVSSNGGESFGPGAARGGYLHWTSPSTVLLSGTNFLISAANVGLGFSAVSAIFPSGAGLNFSSPSPGGSVEGSTLGLDSSGNSVEAYWVLPEPRVRFYRYDGSGSLTEASNWVGPVTVAEGEEPRLAGGASGLFLVSKDSNGTLLNVRKYAGTSFGAPVTLANDTGLMATDSGAIAQSPGGRVAVAWPGTRSDNTNVMRLFSSTDAGASFSEADIARIDGTYDADASLAVGDGGQGWLIFRDSTGLHVADLTPIAGISTQPGIPPTYKGPVKTITTAVGGFLLFLTVPKHCLKPRQPFFIGVGKRARHRIKRSVRGKLKIIKVTFKFDGKKLSTLKKKPFRQLVSPGPLPSGSTHTVVARVTMRLTKKGHRKKVVRVLRGTVKIC
jgi:hypothetical protein